MNRHENCGIFETFLNHKPVSTVLIWNFISNIVLTWQQHHNMSGMYFFFFLNTQNIADLLMQDAWFLSGVTVLKASLPKQRASRRGLTRVSLLCRNLLLK